MKDAQSLKFKHFKAPSQDMVLKKSIVPFKTPKFFFLRQSKNKTLAKPNMLNT